MKYGNNSFSLLNLEHFIYAKLCGPTLEVLIQNYKLITSNY